MWHYFTSSDPHLDTLFRHSFWRTIWKFVYLCIFKHMAHAFIYITLFTLYIYIYLFIYTYSDILSDILPGNTLTFFPVSGIYSDTLFLHITGHFFWDSIWCVFWHSSWHSIWHSFWHSIWLSFWHVVQTWPTAPGAGVPSGAGDMA